MTSRQKDIEPTIVEDLFHISDSITLYQFLETLCTIWSTQTSSCATFLFAENWLEPGWTQAVHSSNLLAEPSVLLADRKVISLLGRDAVDCRRPVQVSNFRSDNETLNKMRCSYVTVIRFSVRLIPNNRNQELAFVCLFDDELRGQDGVGSLEDLAQLTSRAISFAYLASREHASRNLQELAGIFLCISDIRSNHITNYLNRVTEVIQTSMGATALSFFLRDEGGTSLSCMSTTGLLRNDGSTRYVKQDELPIYLGGEHEQSITWQCFSKRKPFLIQNYTGSAEKYIERDLVVADAFNGPMFFCPITCRGVEHKEKEDVLGVMRYSAPISTSTFGGRLSRFQRGISAIDTHFLESLCLEVGPVIGALRNSLMRETEIAHIRHDMHAPINMISDTLNSIQHFDSKSDESKILDLKLASSALRSRAFQLGQKDSYVPLHSEHTLLGRDIISPNIAMLQHYAQKYSMSLEVIGIEKLPSVYIDRELFTRAIYNLVENAIKYGTPKTSIYVTGSVDRDEICIDIKNEGLGIDSTEKSLIFQPRFRASAAIQKRTGTGLGLFLARAAIEKLGGRLTLKCNKEPVVFRISLPVSLTNTPRLDERG